MVEKLVKFTILIAVKLMLSKSFLVVLILKESNIIPALCKNYVLSILRQVKDPTHGVNV